MRIPAIVRQVLTAALLLLLWIMTALWVQPAHSALPSGPLLLVSGETVRTGRLPNRIDLQAGTLLRAQIEPAFVNLPIEDDVLYLFSAARSAALPFDATVGLLPGPLAAVYAPDEAVLDWAVLEIQPAGDAKLLRPRGAAVPLATFLETPGSYAILNTPVLQTPMPVPEPGFGLATLTGLTALLAGARRREKRR